MTKKFLKDSLGWGFLLWLIGYLLGFVFYAFVPANLLGWIIMPIGLIITLLVLFKIVKGPTLRYYLKVAVIWTLIAIVFDYLFLVKVLNPADGYYKLDVYIYYGLTFVLPLIVGAIKVQAKRPVEKTNS